MRRSLFALFREVDVFRLDEQIIALIADDCPIARRILLNHLHFVSVMDLRDRCRIRIRRDIQRRAFLRRIADGGSQQI